MSAQESKADKIESVKANLPLPDQPPDAPDTSSADASTVNVGSGDSKRAANPELTSTDGTREPSSGISEARVSGQTYQQAEAGLDSVGRQRVEGLSNPPSDAVSGDKRDTQGVSATEGKDYGYPKNDPSSGVDGPTRREV